MNTSNVSGMFNTTDLNQSSIVLESAQHRIASYGAMLPVLMVEAMLTGEQPLRPQSVKITEGGWLWMICGRKLFVWQFRSGNKKASASNPCFELELPPSDLVFKADLINLFTPEATKEGEEGRPAPVALIAASPEGTIRYWHNIAFESSFLETTVHDLQGQECSTLCQLSNHRCLLATTTSSLVYVSIHQNELFFRPLRSPQGMLSGFKKFTSFFGMTSVVPVQEQSVKSFIGLYKEISSDLDQQIVYALIGSNLQTWSIESRDTEVLIGDQDLESVLKNSFFHLLSASTDPSSTKILILDAVLPKRRKLEILVALVNESGRGSQGFLLIAVASYSCRGPDTTSSTFVLDSFSAINDPSNLLHKDKNPSDLRLLLCPLRNTSYIYDDSKLYFIRSGTVVDVLDFEQRDDEICGAGICESTPLMFTCRDGLVSITPAAVDFPDLTSSQHNVSLNRSVDEGNFGWFRRALHLYQMNQRNEGETILRSHFNQNSNTSCAEFAALIFDFAMHVIDGKEALDLVPQNLASQPSQEISVVKLLENKKASLSTIQSMIEPFQHVLESVGHRGLPLGLFLTDLIDRLTIVWDIISCYQEYSPILENVLSSVVQKREASSTQDFYNEPSKVTDILPVILEFQETNSKPNMLDADEVVQLHINMSDLLLVVFSNAVSRRSIPDSMLSVFSKKLDTFNPWDSSPAQDGFRKTLLTQIDLLLESGLRLSSTSDVTNQSKGILFGRYVQLANLILESYTFQLKFLNPNSKSHDSVKASFAEVRNKCIRPLLENEFLEKATLLAEKFEDFDILIEICESTGNEEQLDRYRSTFASSAFSSHLGNWYLKNQKPAKVLKMPISSGTNQLLDGHSELLWIQQIRGNDFTAGCKTLKSLADQENENMSRKRTILSLCKLAALVADQSAIAAEADKELHKIFEQQPMESQ
jgi:nuclear pore complex protein Nup133